MRIYMQMQPDPSRDLLRYYQIQIQEDLFGGWSLIREWGEQGKGGPVKKSHFLDYDEAMESLFQIRNRQIKRGYRVMFVSGDGHRIYR